MEDALRELHEMMDDVTLVANDVIDEMTELNDTILKEDPGIQPKADGGMKENRNGQREGPEESPESS